MIYLFTGDDAKGKRKAYESFIKSLPKGTETYFFSKNNFDENQIESFYSGADLFFAKSVIFFENILEFETARDFILEKLSIIAEAESDFVFLESKLNKLILEAFKKAKAELNIFELPKEAKEKFNNFLLANALGNRDKLNLWIYFRQAMNKGVGMEELIGVLFWKAKDMVLKRNFGKFKEAELQEFSSKLSYILPKARKEGKDAEAAFEQFLLESF